MKILLVPPLAVIVFVKTFFVILNHSGQVELVLGFDLPVFFSVYVGNFPVLSPCCLPLLPLDINSLFLTDTQQKFPVQSCCSSSLPVHLMSPSLFVNSRSSRAPPLAG